MKNKASQLIILSWAIGNLYWMSVYKQPAPYLYRKIDGRAVSVITNNYEQ